MFNTYLRLCVIEFKQKKSKQIHSICMKDTDCDYILDEIDIEEKHSLKVIWVPIVTRNSTDVNNHSEISYVAVNYIII